MMGGSPGGGAGPTYAAYVCHAGGADEAVAVAVQRGIERLARPWLRRRAVRVFRGRTAPSGESATHAALDDAQWLVLLASPDAAGSLRVAAELERWLAKQGADAILIALVRGTFSWDTARRDFRWGDPSAVTAVPPALRGALAGEPKYLDLTWAEPDDLNPRNALFVDGMAELAAPLHNAPKNDLVGEDVRAEARNRLLARAVMAALSVLLVVASVAGLRAWNARRQAVAERRIADTQADLAIDRERAATGRRLANLATEGGDDLTPDLRRLLAAEAYTLGASPQADTALRQSLEGMDGTEPGTVPTPDDPAIRVPFAEHTGHDLGSDSLGVRVADDGAVAADGRRFSPGGWEESPLRLPEGSDLQALGPDGRFAVVTRPPSDGREPLLYSYDDFTGVEPSDPEDPLQTITGPVPCADTLGGPPCVEVVLVNLDTRAETVLPPEVGPLERNNTSGRAPNPLVRHRFTPDGHYLLSHDLLGDRLFLTPTDGGEPTPLAESGTVVDFGVLPDGRAWQAEGASLQVLDLPSGDVVERHDISAVGQVTAVAVDAEATTAVVGVAPAGFARVDLASEEVTARRDAVGPVYEATIATGGRWLALNAGGEAQLFDMATLTTMGGVATRYFSAEESPTEAELVFGPEDDYLLVRPLNPPPVPVLDVLWLDPEAWYRAACVSAGRTLTDDEWDTYVGLPGDDRACQDVEGVIGGAGNRVGDPSAPRSATPARPPASTMVPSTAPTPAPPAGRDSWCALFSGAELDSMFPDGEPHEEGVCRTAFIGSQEQTEDEEVVNEDIDF